MGGHTQTHTVCYRTVCIFYLQIMFCLLARRYHAATNGKSGISFLSRGFFSTSFFPPAHSGRTFACERPSVCCGGCSRVAQWQTDGHFSPSHLTMLNIGQRSSDQKMDFISACITGFLKHRGAGVIWDACVLFCAD